MGVAAGHVIRQVDAGVEGARAERDDVRDDLQVVSSGRQLRDADVLRDAGAAEVDAIQRHAERRRGVREDVHGEGRLLRRGDPRGDPRAAGRRCEGPVVVRRRVPEDDPRRRRCPGQGHDAGDEGRELREIRLVLVAEEDVSQAPVAADPVPRGHRIEPDERRRGAVAATSPPPRRDDRRKLSSENFFFFFFMSDKKSSR
mmetsp:Transcript_33844/g.108181  ORF Transcript_33844/g.108181 Transcript_33844/m.108181 type:complete len:200 (+) Transcript_33844:209-808(+)